MDWTPVLEFLKTLAPWVGYVLAGLGSLVVVGSAIDQVIPDEKDKGFMKKVMAVPVLGELLKTLTKFSPFNTRQ